ncbi:alpha/beta hydrolase [Bradyrhizobium sp. BWA-3-5]|uniref:alpha/beta fold hydrolase n=1 Tax=Bradyrhizobium sp. BWA-3-5 TaxID=3080013 RepID=UPI00293EFBBF|nr:alpha/beta hydrolase [Bradyrhizobium sp. BWA-3-5]WOH63766.1 alpha/beta hydrolase [Bradyrhizobium sp. BWA-3-5]
MQESRELALTRLPLRVDGVELNVSAIHRNETLAPIVFLHGFGSTKEDYADIVRHEALAAHSFLAYDAPGCGETHCADLSAVSIPFLLKTARTVIEHFKLDRFHLVGHSMGGLTALLLAHQYPEQVLSFVDIEGNLAPEDCFLSRQIVQYPEQNAERFFAAFIERTRHMPAYASALYASALHYKVRAGAVPGIFRSMVEMSDSDELIEKFNSLSCPRMFMYGEQNATLSYLNLIRAKGARLAEIPACGHFPMYSNPIAMWTQIAQFVNDTDSNR